MASPRPNDWAQRQAALDPGRSFIVQAPAGSGKTGLLTQRFLRLLATAGDPEEIVAITFTLKAAAEMRGRILRALEAARGDAPDEPYERETWALARDALAHARSRDWRLLENPQRLRIRTIDSLCQYIARQMPLRSGFGDMPGIEQSPEGLYAAAARSVLNELESGGELSSSLETLLRALDNNVDGLQTLIAGMLEQRNQWLRHVVAPERRENIERALRGVVVAQLQRLRACFPGDVAAELPALAGFAASQVPPDHVLSACCDLESLPPARLDCLPVWNALTELLLTTTGEWRKRVDKRNGFPAGPEAAGAKQAMHDLLERLRPEQDLAAALNGLRTLPEAGYTDMDWSLIQDLFRVLTTAVAHLRVTFMEHGKVDFSEMALAAREALGTEGEPTDLALRLDYQVRHLLVDEFQDTSQDQHGLIERLTAGWQEGDGRTLFLVGDPMQSIYGFRKAEVGLFLDAWEGRLGGIRLEPLRLSVNFRSEAGVIDWVNGCFPAVFPAAGDKVTGAVSYAPSEAFRAPGEGPAVTVQPFIGRDDEAEAERVSGIIEESRAGNPAGTVAVLVRSKTHLEPLIAELRRRGLRFQAVEIGALRHRPAVMDLISLTLALLHPADRISWLALLNGPLCGLSLQDLHALTGAECDGHWSALPALLLRSERRDALSGDGRTRVARLMAVLEPALDGRERLALRDWVEGAWLALGGPATLPDQGAIEDVEVYFQFLQSVDDGNQPLSPERIRDGVEELFSLPDPLADGSLQLMTIHKAKGLEFDTVILPGLGKRPRGDSPKLLYWLETTDEEGHPELFFGPLKPTGADAPHRTSAWIRNLEAEKGRLESGRLLYVAATRAKRRLHLLGHAEERKDGSLSVAGGSLLAELWEALGGHWEAAHQDKVGEDSADYLPDGEPHSHAPASLRAGWRCPEPPETVGGVAEPAAEPDEGVIYEWAGGTARAVGTVVHRWLQFLVHTRRSRLEDCPGFERTAGRMLQEEGVASAALPAALARVRSALEHSLSDDRGRWILSPRHQDSRCEVPVTAVVGGRPRRMIIDRTFIDGEGTRWIIDYKTGIHQGGDIEGFLDEEQERYRAQLEGYVSAFRKLEQREIRAALFYPLVPGGWRELEL